MGLPGAFRIKPKAFQDGRGWFAETYKVSEFVKAGILDTFVQDNHSHSVGRGVIRGLHFQRAPMAQGKLVRCVSGAIFDVAVDIRRESPTFGRWVGAELSAANREMLWVPSGFAHGFQTLSDEAEVIYKVTNEYSPPHEGALRWDDPEVGVQWPVENPVLNDRDRNAPNLADLR